MNKPAFSLDATKEKVLVSGAERQVQIYALPVAKPYDAVKRVLDVCLSLMGLVLLSPVFLLICVAIFIDDPHGGPFYVSDRIGKDRKVFRFYKFRSMCVDAEKKLDSLMHMNEADGPAFKIKEDPRITRVGRFIRRTSLDELPQLLNVLKGDMAIVGPRPPIGREVELYTNYQLGRLAVRPGLTCYWQVQPSRNKVSFDQWVEMDLRYIRERGFWVDLGVLVRTVRVVVWGSGE